MIARMTCIALVCSLLGSTRSAFAQFESSEQVRIVEENGMRYRETRTISRRPVTEVRTDEREVTVQQPETVTRLHQASRIIQVPVRSQQVVTQRFWWNPWRWGHPVSWVEPTTVWRPQVQYTWVPTSTVQFVPTTQTVRTPQRILRFEEDEQVSRVALGPSNNSVGEIASRPNAPQTSSGSFSRFDADPPRRPAPVTDLVPTILR